MQNTDDCQERMQALGRSRPLAFTTAKSRLGHAETGAGVLGMLHAWRQLSQGTTHSITHLRSVNPYVASTLEGSRGAAALLPRCAALVSGMPSEVPREAAPEESRRSNSAAYGLGSLGRLKWVGAAKSVV